MAYGKIKADTFVYDNSGSDVEITVSTIPSSSSPTFTGNLTMNAQGDIRLADSDSSNYVGFQAPATVASNVVWTLPSADGSSGQQLSTNGSGVLSWTAPTNTAAADLTGNTLASGVTASSLTSVGTLSSLTIDGDVTFTGASSNGLWDKSANAFVANVTGNLTGNVTGNVTGDVTGNCSGTAATVTGAAQSAITSLGTLTALDVGGIAEVDHLYVTGGFTSSRDALTQSATPAINCNLGNYFTLTQNQNVTSWSLSNIPASGKAYALTLELQNSSYSTAWSGFTNLKWAGGSAPTLDASKAHLIIFITDDGGSNWRAAAVTNFTV